MTNDLKTAISDALDWLERKHKRIDPATADLAVWHGIKSPAYYERVIAALVKDLTDGLITAEEFVDKMGEALGQQLTRAWLEGMRKNGLTPDDLEDTEDELDAVIENERGFLLPFALLIVAGTLSMPQVQQRIALWSARYEDVKNQAVLATAKGRAKLKWSLGATEEHCEQCARLDGVVAYAEEWQELEVHPQSPPNALIDCGGWKCDCSLDPTDEPRTKGAYDFIASVVS